MVKSDEQQRDRGRAWGTGKKKRKTQGGGGRGFCGETLCRWKGQTEEVLLFKGERTVKLKSRDEDGNLGDSHLGGEKKKRGTVPINLGSTPLPRRKKKKLSWKKREGGVVPPVRLTSTAT